MEQVTTENMQRVQTFIESNLKRSTFIYGNISRSGATTKFLQRDGEIVGLFNSLDGKHLSLLFSSECTKEEMDQIITEAHSLPFVDGTVVGVPIDQLTDYFDFDHEESINDYASMVINRNTKFTIDSKVQDVKYDDFERFIEANDVAFKQSVNVERMKKLHEHNILSMIVEDDIVVSGATVTAISDKTAVVVGVFTLEEYRGRGYARKVVEHALNKVKDKERLIMIFFSNPIAEKIYLDIGFEIEEQLIMFKRKINK